jgi:hypothetical protein
MTHTNGSQKSGDKQKADIKAWLTGNQAEAPVALRV